MIDFRYHVVSLVAVFIALAVGIALGAGPLREGISDTLEGEVSQLREERTALRTELDATRLRAQAKDDGLGVVAERTVAGTLSGSRVALVTLPGSDRNQVAALEEAVEAAGGTLALTAELDSSWESLARADEAQETAHELAPTLDLPEPREGEEPTLATVVAATLTGADAVGQTGAWLGAAEQLRDAGYLDVRWGEDAGAGVLDRRPADAFLVVGGSLTMPAEEEPDEDLLATAETRLDLLAALADLDAPTVLAAEGTETLALQDGSGLDMVVRSVREDRSLRSEISTVDNLESASGRLASVLALAWEVAEESGQYGLGPLADTPMPVPPPVRIVSGPPGDDALVTSPVPDEDQSTGAVPDDDQVTGGVPDDAASTGGP